MAERRVAEMKVHGVRTATTIAFERCPCNTPECHTMFLVLYDERGKAFASAGMLAEEWRRFCLEAPAEIAWRESPQCREKAEGLN